MTFNSTVNILQKEIQKGNIMHYITQISQFHRIQASSGFYNALNYVRSELEKIKVTSKVYTFPANGEKDEWGWVRPITWNVHHGELWLTRPVKKRLSSFLDTPMSVITHSKPIENLIGKVVDVGEGAKSEDYHLAEGKIALITANPRTIFPIAYEAGVLGVIYHPDQKRIADFGSNTVQYGGFWPSADNFSKLIPGFSISHNQALEITQFIKQKKEVEVEFKIKAEFKKEDGLLHVLEALIEGEKNLDTEIIIIAHLCHPAKGANDNASGSGTLLEIVRSLKYLFDNNRISKPACSLKFLWVPEFSGTLPWLYKLNQDRLKGNNRNILACFNLDMIGECPCEVGTPLVITNPSLGTPSYLVSLIKALADILSEEKGLISTKGQRYNFNYRISPFQGGSDHYLFNDSRFLIPSVMFGHDDPFWHSSADDLSKIEPLECRSAAILATAAALLIASPTQDDVIEIYNNTYVNGLKEILDLKYVEEDKFTRIDYTEQLKLLKSHILRRLSSIDKIHQYPINREQIEFLKENIKLHSFSKINTKELVVSEKSSSRKYGSEWYKSNFDGPVPYSVLIYEEKEERNKEFLTNIFKEFWGGILLEFFNLLPYGSLREVYLLLKLSYPNIKWEDIERCVDIFEKRDLIQLMEK